MWEWLTPREADPLETPNALNAFVLVEVSRSDAALAFCMTLGLYLVLGCLLSARHAPNDASAAANVTLRDACFSDAR